MEFPMPQGRELPVVNFREIDLPELRGWEIGGKYYLVLKVEMVEKRNNTLLDMERNDQSKLEATFKVTNVKALGKSQVDSKKLEKEEQDELYAKARSQEE